MKKKKSKYDWEASYQALLIVTVHQLISMQEQLTDTIEMLAKHAPGFDFEIKKAEEESKRLEDMLAQRGLDKR